MTMTKSQLISPADGKVVETLTDPRVLATGVGVTVAAFGEKALFKSARQLFGVATPAAGGEIKYFEAKADGSADTSKEHPQFRTNRTVARGIGVVACIAGIEFSNSAPAQYGLLGAASLFMAHIVQDAVPFLR